MFQLTRPKIKLNAVMVEISMVVKVQKKYIANKYLLGGNWVFFSFWTDSASPFEINISKKHYPKLLLLVLSAI